MRPLAIFGAGGFAREVRELVRDINEEKPQWEIIGFLSDEPSTWGTAVNDLPVLGGQPWLEARSKDAAVVLGIGGPAAKYRITERLKGVVREWPRLIHPSVITSAYVTYGEGVVITAGNILTANIQLASFTMLNLACTVGHDCVLGNFVTVAPGVNISGNVRVGDGCDIGTGASIVQGVELGEWSIVGAGAVIAKSLPSNCTAVGVPAKVIKQRDAGWQHG